MMSSSLKTAAESSQQIKELFLDRGWTLGLAESCTGGALAAQITQLSGVSQFFKGSVVSYADTAKKDLLAIPERVLLAHNSVSRPVALRMALGAKAQFKSTWALSTTGFAGPDGGHSEAPVGTLYMGIAGPAFEWSGQQRLEVSDRKTFIEKATELSLETFLRIINN